MRRLTDTLRPFTFIKAENIRTSTKMTILQSIKDEFNRRMYEEGVWRIISVLGMLNDDDVWYCPNNHANSIGHLILHLCGNVTQWIGSGLGGRPDLRDRDFEFHTTERLSKESLISNLRGLRPMTDEALTILQKDDDLLKFCSVQGYDETALSIIIHVIEHFSYHTGQIAIIAKYLKDADLGFYAGQDLNAKS